MLILSAVVPVWGRGEGETAPCSLTALFRQLLFKGGSLDGAPCGGVSNPKVVVVP